MKPDYLADDELNTEAPGLSKIKKENPFSVPENYFDSLADNIQQKIASLPDVERMKRDNPFGVPEGYFESLPTAVQQRISNQKNKGFVFREWISVAFRPKYALAFAAVIILIIFGINYLSKTGTVAVPEPYLTCEEVKSSSYLDDMDESMLVEVIEPELSAGDEKEDNSLKEYLLDNNIDISQLENQL